MLACLNVFLPLNAGKKFPASYTRDLKQRMAELGRIGETGCPEYFFY